MDRILVTGGTGFVGHWMKQTQPKGYDCKYIGRADYDAGHWHDVRWNYIAHLAPVPPYLVASQAATNNARLLYCSSGIVYHPENNTEYRRDKINGELYCIDSGIDVVIARLFTFYGYGLDDNKAIVQFERAANAGKPLTIWGDGSCVRSYMSGHEMGRWLWAILFKGKSGEAYDVGSDEPITMLELAKQFSDNVIIQGGKDAMPKYLPHNTAKARKLL